MLHFTPEEQVAWRDMTEDQILFPAFAAATQKFLAIVLANVIGDSVVTAAGPAPVWRPRKSVVEQALNLNDLYSWWQIAADPDVTGVLNAYANYLLAAPNRIAHVATHNLTREAEERQRFYGGYAEGDFEDFLVEGAAQSFPLGMSDGDNRLLSHLAETKDRLIYGRDVLGVTAPENAFEMLQETFYQAHTLGWSRDELSEQIAQKLSWVQPNREFMQRKYDNFTRQLKEMVDKGTPKTDDMFQMLQRLRSDTRRELDADESVWAARSRMIARTEATQLNGYSSILALEEEGVKEKAWLAGHDGRTRETHAEADGQVRDLKEDFNVGGYQLLYPGDARAPAEEVINCVDGSTQVEWAGQEVHAVTSRWIDGPMFKIVTARGHNLTCTPNHPILTTSGYVPAKSLRFGDNVLSADLAPAPQVENGPPSIQELKTTLLETGTPRRVSGGRMDFHGDGAEREVQIIRADSHLRLEDDSERLGEVAEETFVVLGNRPGSLSTASDSERPLGSVKSSEVSPSASPRIVGAGREFSPLGDGEAAHAKAVGFTPAPDWESELVESPSDYWPTDSEGLRHAEDALSLGMSPDKVVEVYVLSGARHEVFNLSTSEGWYTGNSIAQHNCRCTVISKAVSEEATSETPTVERLPGESAADYAERSKAILGGMSPEDFASQKWDAQHPDDVLFRDSGFVRLADDADTDPRMLARYTNQKYSITTSRAGYQTNCPNTTMAWEYRMRGWNVGAAPLPDGRKIEAMTSMWQTKEGHRPIQVESFRKDWRLMDEVMKGSKSEDYFIDKLSALENKFPNNSRGAVALHWKGGGGHVFNWMKDSTGNVDWIESQTPTVPLTKGIVRREYLKNVDRDNNVTMMRFDNANLKPVSDMPRSTEVFDLGDIFEPPFIRSPKQR